MNDGGTILGRVPRRTVTGRTAGSRGVGQSSQVGDTRGAEGLAAVGETARGGIGSAGVDKEHGFSSKF